MCEMVDTYTSRSAQVACATVIKTKNDNYNRNQGYDIQIEGPYLVEKLQRTRGHTQSNYQPHSHVRVVEEPNNTKE